MCIIRSLWKQYNIVSWYQGFETDLVIPTCNPHIYRLAEMRDKNYLAILPTCLYTGQGAPPTPKDNPSLKVVIIIITTR